MVVEDGLAKAVENSSRDDIGLNVLPLEVKDAVLDVFNPCVLAARPPLEVVLLRERVVQVPFALEDRLGFLGCLFFHLLFDHVFFLIFAVRLFVATKNCI